VFGNIGYVEVCIIIAIVAAVVVWPAWRIVSKTGHPGILALGFFVPLLNIVLVLFLAFSEWPLERQPRELEQRSASPGA
jgi:predicted PurR-regulated permease PerM